MPGKSVFDKMSSGEREVSKQLTHLGLYWLFESPVFVTDDKSRPRLWSPDFFLPQLGLYIEVMGDLGNYHYRSIVYDKNNIPIIFIDPYNDAHWHLTLINRIADVFAQRFHILKQLFLHAA